MLRTPFLQSIKNIYVTESVAEIEVLFNGIGDGRENAFLIGKEMVYYGWKDESGSYGGNWENGDCYERYPRPKGR